MNTSNVDIFASQQGVDFLWTIFALYMIAFLGAIITDVMRPKGATRVFHQMAVAILTVGSLAYFCMASVLGATSSMESEFAFASEGIRQVWYVRYVQWYITFPLLLAEILLLTGLSHTHVVMTLTVAIIIVVCGVIGVLVSNTWKYLFYSLSVVGVFYIWSILLWHGRRLAHNAYRLTYLLSAMHMSLMLLVYPISWAIIEGTSLVSPSAELVWYAVLDVLAGPIFLVGFLWQVRHFDYETIGFGFGGSAPIALELKDLDLEVGGGLRSSSTKGDEDDVVEFEYRDASPVVQ